MAQPKAMKPAANRRAMNTHLAVPLQRQAQFIQRQVALLGEPPADPAFQSPQLAGTAQVALRLWLKAARLPAQLDHVVHELRRNAKMTRRLPVRAALVDKGNNPLP